MNKFLKQKTFSMTNNGLSKVSSKNKQGGFTLIEIAIVLVIIGLLLGGVLKGQELINTARVRALNNTVDGITAAWFSFQDRYRAFPGDYTQATVNLPGITVDPDGNGNGNGQVDTDPERNNVWVHLEAAGYITGGYNDETLSVAPDYSCGVAQCPDNGFGSGMSLSHGELRQAQTGTNAHELITGQGIPVEVLAELDRKVDDGQAGSGAMQLGIDAAGWTGTAEACQNTDDDNLYGVQEPSSNCAAVFRNF